jgi:uncharacterized protein DUF6069
MIPPMTTTTSTQRCSPAARRIRLGAILAASISTLVLWVMAVPVGGSTLDVRQGDGTMTVGAIVVVLVTALAGFAGWGLLAVLESRTQQARKTWTAIAIVFLAFSLLGPLGQGIGLTTKLVLTAMHLTAGAVLIPQLARTARGG